MKKRIQAYAFGYQHPRAAFTERALIGFTIGYLAGFLFVMYGLLVLCNKDYECVLKSFYEGSFLDNLAWFLNYATLIPAVCMLLIFAYSRRRAIVLHYLIRIPASSFYKAKEFLVKELDCEIKEYKERGELGDMKNLVKECSRLKGVLA